MTEFLLCYFIPGMEGKDSKDEMAATRLHIIYATTPSFSASFLLTLCTRAIIYICLYLAQAL